ncbi:RING-H2 finger protein ATL17-like [Actinidia eriantha]|uniref:RING-H2 finger protein ATL17-like n=1 Tax=Actinidia eriantha TaxID=165200 RepID=UPI00258A767B|nr:RING-H2 finger protein ATL17-like [Actinidia eriantha]
MEIVVSVILLLVGIVVLVTIHVCVVGRAFRRGDFNNGNAILVQRHNISRSTPRMSQDEIRKLPCFDYEVGEKGKSSLECAVCLESFKVGDVCRLLPQCKHSFHVQCIDSWLLKTAVCPICRTGANFSPKIGGGQSSNSGGEGGVLELAANEQIQNLF